MNVRLTRSLIHTASVTTAVATMGICGWNLRPTAGSPPSAVSIRSGPAAEVQPEAPIADSGFDSTPWERSLRGPLQDPPRPKPVVVKAPPKRASKPAPPRPPAVNITLVGTALESGRDLGIFADANGRIDLKQVGETLDLIPAGVRVESLAANVATVSLAGRETKLQISSGGGKRPKNNQNRFNQGGRR